ncbi:hypothetical protein AC579_10131 [Pseudocercospora musae]|uniref:GPI anchored protein n=1 Tax=Pseudocercospora musae TaxID=113226 RepID=A0A139ISD0_9PEZI|nr:hypothetical protein AC579_10131 [Pseudocercospora musae]
MRGYVRLLALPASLLVFLASFNVEVQALEWPYNLPRSARYYPEDEEHVKSGLEAQQKLSWKAPVGMRKMGDDPGEKFFMHYWEFGEEPAVPATDAEEQERQRIAYHNSLEPVENTTLLLPAVFCHTFHDRILGRSLFARDFECPSGFQKCDNVDSDVCCQNGELCVSTSNGVGCCPKGAYCGDRVAACDTAAGYQSCANDEEGGCCLPGSPCADGGCVFFGTATVTTTLPTSTVRSMPSTQQPTTVIVTQSGSATTVTITMSGDDTTETVTVTEPTTIVLGGGAGTTHSPRSCTMGFRSCPASLGGGCCRSDQNCATSSSCEDVTTTTSATANAPVRPTSSTESSDTSISAAGNPETSSTTNTEGCPTGFYMCSAVYLGGCCRVDRDCHTTSCPPTATTNVVTASGLTVAADATGSCANGWASCADDAGGGCCPSGYLCASNCINTAGGSNTTKQSPSAAVVESFAWSLVFVGVTAALGMLLL